MGGALQIDDNNFVVALAISTLKETFGLADNHRNGSIAQTALIDDGPLTLDIPPGRAISVEPHHQDWGQHTLDAPRI